MPITLPTPTRTWVISPCNRIAFVSLIDATQQVLYRVKTFLLARGYTVRGSASAGTGAMDSTDRWSNAAAVTPRATTSAASQAWIVLRDGNGADILFAFQGASDDIARISFSAGGLFVAAGTPNNQPTATDEEVIWSATTLVNATASGDRLLSLWGTADAKNFRWALARANVWTGGVIGVERVGAPDSGFGGGVTFTPDIAGFGNLATQLSHNNGTSAYAANSTGARARVVIGGTSFSIGAGIGCLKGGGLTSLFSNGVQHLQGSNYGLLETYLVSQTASATGNLGKRVDWWLGKTTAAGAVDGDVYGTNQFIQLGETAWPWDGSVPVMA